MKKKPTEEQIKYNKKVSAMAPKSKAGLQCLLAFASGGAICCIGQLVHDAGNVLFQFTESELSAFTAIVMVFLGALLTGVGVYDKIGSWAGAGSVVPITGFANSVVAPAMEFKREGLVLGVGAKLFTIAGPVLACGISASIIVGLIACIPGVTL